MSIDDSIITRIPNDVQRNILSYIPAHDVTVDMLCRQKEKIPVYFSRLLMHKSHIAFIEWRYQLKCDIADGLLFLGVRGISQQDGQQETDHEPRKGHVFHA